ncbi:hypothetical protein B0T25DRAFT_505989 [Lasiosphaeria hispida]|uniref:Dyp-type peroxidase n=1 Tax=Lasiosphaeria hispida TaxID=260671 RepID=A0AAJ0MAA2_9PEZI|nr:hypothetical protein B0T25DRAFT_505989 [Lasiosphaeria hispida]
MHPDQKLETEQLNDIQGDIWSKGFPKNNETYYRFQIAPGSASTFAHRLRKMVTEQPSLISNLTTVIGDQGKITKEKQRAKAAGVEPETLPMANALIAFTFKGLQVIGTGLSKPGDLGLKKILKTDPAFSQGMGLDSGVLSDRTTDLDPLFAHPDGIHGLLKVAGSSEDMVGKRLKTIQDALGWGTVIKDVPGGTAGRVDGATRDKPNRGKEHFGFQDGISQPLMYGIDDTPPKPDPGASATSTMDTEPSILIVTKDTHRADSDRPVWMHRGSFLVLRKLEQDVEAFHELTKKYNAYNCQSPDHMGAKLMGRWPSGAPIALPAYHTTDAPATDHEEVKEMNNFGYEKTDGRACPFTAHIRKTNPRRLDEWNSNSPDQGLKFSKIIRGGIPYGPDYAVGEAPGLKRGLLFACYQGCIEDGFQHMQRDWCNTSSFPETGSGIDPGIDPIVGQVVDPTAMKTLIAEGTQPLLIKPQLVTFRGGEYFFVPSIKALKGALTEAAP